MKTIRKTLIDQANGVFDFLDNGNLCEKDLEWAAQTLWFWSQICITSANKDLLNIEKIDFSSYDDIHAALTKKYKIGE